MLLGLFRRRFHKTNFGFGRLLLKQVLSTVLAGCEDRHDTDVTSVHKSIAWLLLATVAEVPPAVSLNIFLTLLIVTHFHFMPQVFIVLNLNGIHAFSSALRLS